MRIHVEWLVQDRVIGARFADTVNADDVWCALTQTRQLLERGKPPIYALVDATHLRQWSLSLREMRGAFTGLRSARGGGVVIYGAAPQIAGYLIVAYTQTTDRGVRSVRTVAEARALINRIDGKPLLVAEARHMT
ncbi:MAG: hypothetical protein HC828_19360 [Blastochloris sp.]|nr:hypothetical protein [Blastochloris sp.]